MVGLTTSISVLQAFSRRKFCDIQSVTLLKSIHENNLQEALSETVTLLQIIITTPMTNTESEKLLHLKKNKNIYTEYDGTEEIEHPWQCFLLKVNSSMDCRILTVRP